MPAKRRKIEQSPPPAINTRSTTRSTRSSAINVTTKTTKVQAGRGRRPGINLKDTKTAVNQSHLLASLPFLPLPSPPVRRRPGLELVGWGNGHDGQLGKELPSVVDKPKKNRWMTQKMEEGVFGHEPGAGLESIASGGMHSLFVDEKGSVSLVQVTKIL